jgi:hypothetical protein
MPDTSLVLAVALYQYWPHFTVPVVKINVLWWHPVDRQEVGGAWELGA